ncbi:hypothetical protein DFH06DRAFT_1132346 [Mycena polygramma]|nr:hypothetical protein DFH06DRAFT_1132346 [Mycena polygramma]
MIRFPRDILVDMVVNQGQLLPKRALRALYRRAHVLYIALCSSTALPLYGSTDLRSSTYYVGKYGFPDACLLPRPSLHARRYASGPVSDFSPVHIMPQKIATPLQDAVLAAVRDTSYQPAALPPLEDQHWESFASEPTDTADNSEQKKLLKAYEKRGKMALEHAVVLILGDDVLDYPDSFVKALQCEVLCGKVLEAIVGKLDARLMQNDASHEDEGFLQFVGALWTSLNFDTGELTASLWPTFEPLVDAAVAAYTQSKRPKKQTKQKPAASASVPKRTTRVTGGMSNSERLAIDVELHSALRFLMNLREIQSSRESQVSLITVSPTQSASSDSDDSMSSAHSGVDGNASPPYRFRVESPCVSPSTFDPEPSDISGIGAQPFDFNRSFKFPPAVLRTPVRMTEGEALRGRDFFTDHRATCQEYSPAMAYDLSDAPMPSPPTFKLPRDLALARNPEDTVLREIENVSPPSGCRASQLGPAFVPVVKKITSNATASSSKLTLDSGLGSTAVVKSPGRSPFTRSNGRSPRTGGM